MRRLPARLPFAVEIAGFAAHTPSVADGDSVTVPLAREPPSPLHSSLNVWAVLEASITLVEPFVCRVPDHPPAAVQAEVRELDHVNVAL